MATKKKPRKQPGAPAPKKANPQKGIPREKEGLLGVAYCPECEEPAVAKERQDDYSLKMTCSNGHYWTSGQ